MTGDLMFAESEVVAQPNTRMRSKDSWLARAMCLKRWCRWCQIGMVCQPARYILRVEMRDISQQMLRRLVSRLLM